MVFVLLCAQIVVVCCLLLDCCLLFDVVVLIVAFLFVLCLTRIAHPGQVSCDCRVGGTAKFTCYDDAVACKSMTESCCGSCLNPLSAGGSGKSPAAGVPGQY